MNLYRTDDGTKWGTGKGANLTASEIDLNFWGMEQRILTMEQNPPEATSITNIQVIGSQVKFFMSDGSFFGPFDLPIVTFQNGGEWQNDFDYEPLELVTVPQRGLYLVNIAHQTPAAPALFDPDAVDGNGDPLYTLVFGTASYLYDFGFFYPGKPGLGIVGGGAMASHMIARSILLPASLPGSIAKLRIAATADLSFALYDQTDTQIGSVDFLAGELDGSFTFTDAWSGAAGDFIYLQPPTAIDATARDLMITFAATRVLE